MWIRLVLVALIWFATPAFAQDAASCIQLERAEKSQTLRNACTEQVVVFWCHDDTSPGSKSDACGASKRYYRLNTVIKPGQTISNPYSLPLGAQISFGACRGDYLAYQYTDTKGGYRCKPPIKAADGTVVMTGTASAATEDEACSAARLMADKGGNPGECSCQQRGKVTICRVQWIAAAPAKSVISTVKGQVREVVKCKPDEQDCAKRSSRNGGSGIRD